MNTFAPFIITVMCLYSTFLEICTKHNTSLRLTHVIFRHGDRTPMRTIYANDPYERENYYPYGYSQLTKVGKQKVYDLGRWLRQRYDTFLNKTFTHKEVSALTTNLGRTKCSLALVLAGLYPPKQTALEWNPTINWNPINYKILPVATSLLMMPYPQCKHFFKYFQGYTNSRDGQTVLKKYNRIREHLSNYTHLVYNSTFNYLNTYDLLSVQKEMGLQLPNWAEDVLPTLSSSPVDFVKSSTGTEKLRQIVVGHLIKKVIDDTKLKLNSTQGYKNKKMFLYSGHDLHVAYLLELIKPTLNYERSPYSSSLIFEIHKINNIEGVKVFYRHGVNARLRSVSINNCGKFCPFKEFESLMEKYFPVYKGC